jgi:hypothetical protein
MTVDHTSSAEHSDLQYWDRFAKGAILGALGRLAPAVALHVTLAPYRRWVGIEPYAGGLGRLGRRLYCGLFDATVALLVDGYSELTGTRMKTTDGSVALMFIRVLSAIDDEIDRRIAADEAVDLANVLDGGIVAARLRSWDDLGRRLPNFEAVMSQYWEVGRLHFDSYVQRLGSPEFRTDLPSQLAAIELDSGEQLQWLVRTWAMFHEEPVSDAALQEFFAIGVAGKLADDLADFRVDLAHGSPNVLFALLARHDSELATAIAAAASDERMDLEWWRTHCKRSFRDFTRIYRRYNDGLTAAGLRRASYLMILPVVRGLARVPRR